MPDLGERHRSRNDSIDRRLIQTKISGPICDILPHMRAEHLVVRVLKKQPDIAERFVAARLIQWPSKQLNVSGYRLESAGHELEESRLATTIRAAQHNHLATPDGQIEFVYFVGAAALVGKAKIVALEHRGR